MCWNAASLPRRFELSGEQDAIHQVVGAYYEAFARDPAAAAAFYGAVPFRVVQLAWPDRRGWMPWEVGFEQRLMLAQPVIGSLDEVE